MVKDEDTTLGTEVLRALRDEFNADAVREKESFGPQICLWFFTTVGEECPAFMYKNMTCLAPHLEHEPWHLRAGVLFAYAAILKSPILDPPKSSPASEEETTNNRVRKRAKNDILNVLLDRSLDISFSVRTRVLKMWTNLVQEHRVPAKFLCAQIAPMAVQRLEDKNALVRRAAMELLIRCLMDNPVDPEGQIPFDLDLAKKHLKEAEERLEVKEKERVLTAEEAIVLRLIKQQLNAKSTGDEDPNKPLDIAALANNAYQQIKNGNGEDGAPKPPLGDEVEDKEADLEDKQLTEEELQAAITAGIEKLRP